MFYISAYLFINKKLLKNKDYFIILYILKNNKITIFFYTIVNSNTISYIFINKTFVRYHNLLFYKLKVF